MEMAMRRLGWTAVAAAMAGLALMSGGRAAAMAGTCKERGSSTAAWQTNNRTFEQCKATNQQRDGDNVFDQQGLVWWDVRG